MTQSTINYIIDGIIYDTSKYPKIFSDGAFSNEGIDIFMISEDKFLQINWTNYQGSHDSAFFIERENLIQFLLNRDQHPDRVINALKEIGEDIRKYKPRGKDGKYISDGEETKTVRLTKDLADLGRHEIQDRLKDYNILNDSYKRTVRFLDENKRVKQILIILDNNFVIEYEEVDGSRGYEISEPQIRKLEENENVDELISQFEKEFD